MRNPVLSCVLLALAACSRAPEPTPAPSTVASPAETAATAGAHPATPPAASASAASQALALHWTDPPRWQRRPPSTSMRAAEYLIPRAAGDSEDGECIVITFGPGQGGGVEENVDRWVAQFANATKPERSERQMQGLRVTRVEVAGTYTPMRMPGMPAAPSSRPGWRLVGAIVEAPSGLWFFKVTGPSATVKAASLELETMLGTASASPR